MPFLKEGFCLLTERHFEQWCRSNVFYPCFIQLFAGFSHLFGVDRSCSPADYLRFNSSLCHSERRRGHTAAFVQTAEMQRFVAFLLYKLTQLSIGKCVADKLVKTVFRNYIQSAEKLSALSSRNGKAKEQAVCGKVLYYVTNVYDITAVFIVLMYKLIYCGGQLSGVVGELCFSFLLEIVVLHVNYNECCFHSFALRIFADAYRTS